MNIVEKFVTGVIAIGLVVAFATHASGISKVAGAASNAGSGLLKTAEHP